MTLAGHPRADLLARPDIARFSGQGGNAVRRYDIGVLCRASHPVRHRHQLDGTGTVNAMESLALAHQPIDLDLVDQGGRR